MDPDKISLSFIMVNKHHKLIADCSLKTSGKIFAWRELTKLGLAVKDKMAGAGSKRHENFLAGLS